MWRSRKFIIGTLLAIVVLGGSIGGIALAQAGDDSTPTKSLMTRVAEKLGIDEDTLQTAFDEAQQEMRDEALTNRLQDLVEEGVITQDEADEYGAWWQARPDISAKFGFDGRGMFGGMDRIRGRIMLHDWGGPCLQGSE